MTGPPTNITEAAFQQAIVEAALARGWRVFHVSDSRREVIDRRRGVSFLVGDQLARGWPDLTLAHPRHRIFAMRELKTNTGRVTDQQRTWLELLTLCGIDAGVWRPRHWQTIDAFLRGDRQALEAETA